MGEPRRLHIDCATNVSEEFQGQHITSLHVSVPCLGIPDGGSTIGAAPLNALVAATTRRDAPFCVRSLDTFFELFAQRHGREGELCFLVSLPLKSFVTSLVAITTSTDRYNVYTWPVLQLLLVIGPLHLQTYNQNHFNDFLADLDIMGPNTNSR